MSTQPGRLGGRTTIPRQGSRGPGDAIPTPTGSARPERPAASRTWAAIAQMRPMTASGPSAPLVATARRSETVRSGATWAARIWVPPRSIARTGWAAPASTGDHSSRAGTRNRPPGLGGRSDEGLPAGYAEDARSGSDLEHLGAADRAGALGRR